jgi:transposase-like protein
MSSHSVPLHCPYCAGENLHPHGERHGAWECRECLRAFTVGFIGLLNPATATQRGNAETSPSGGLQ